MGGAGARRRPAYRAYFHVFPDRECRTPGGPCPGCLGLLRPATSPGIRTARLGLDDVQRVAVGRRLVESGGPRRVRTDHPSPGQSGVDVFSPRCDRLMWKRMGPTARASPRSRITRALKGVDPVGLPVGGLQGGGHRGARRSYLGTGSHRQGGRSRLPQQPHGADLVGAGQRDVRLAAHALGNLPPKPATATCGDLLALPRRHRLGDHGRDAAALGFSGAARLIPRPVVCR